MAAVLTVVLVVLGLGGITLGRVVATKADVRRAADSAALSAAELLRDKGRVSLQPATNVGNLNLPNRATSWQAMTLDERPGFTAAQPGFISVGTEPNVVIDTPVYAFTVDRVQVREISKAYVREVAYRNFAMPDLKIMLVLDYSGSMGGERMQMLEDTVQKEVLENTMRIEWAAVLYDDKIVGKAEFGPESKGNIKKLLEEHDAGGGTMTGMGMKEGLEELSKTGSPNATGGAGVPDRWLLVISDGVPGDAEAAKNTAREAIKEKGYGIMSLLIGSDQMQFMDEIAGVPGKDFPDPDKEYSFAASDPAKVRAKFRQILKKIACPTPGPLAKLDTVKAEGQPSKPGCVGGRLDNCQRVGAVLRRQGGGGERALQLVKDEPASGEAFLYDQQKRAAEPSWDACMNAIRNREEFVVRYNRARLVDNKQLPR